MDSRRLVSIFFLVLCICSGAEAQSIRSASLEVTTRPAGASLVIDGRDAGVTPITIEDIVPGRHHLVLELPGYETYREWILFSAGDEIRRDIDLSVRTGTVELVVPDYIDRSTLVVSAGSTTYTGPTLNLPVGTYSLDVRSFGYRPYRTIVSVTAGGNTTIDVPMEPVFLDVEEFRPRTSLVSPHNPPPFDRIVLDVRTNAPSRYELVILDSARIPIHRADGSIDGPDPIEIQWEPPVDTTGGLYRLIFTAYDERSSVTKTRDLRVSPAAVVFPRVPSIYGRGTSLARIPSGSTGVRAISFGSGYVPAEGDRGDRLPVSGALSFFPYPRWEATVAARGAADTSGDEWSGVAALTLSTPPVVDIVNARFRVTATIDLHGAVGRGDPSPWRHNSLGLAVATAFESVPAGLGLAIHPGVYADLEKPDDPGAGLYTGTALYLHRSGLLLAASGRFEYAPGDAPTLLYGVDAAIRVSSLPAYVATALVVSDVDPRISIQASCIILR